MFHHDGANLFDAHIVYSYGYAVNIKVDIIPKISYLCFMLDIEKIRRLREKLGMTQEEAAKKAGMASRQEWNHVEKGRRPKLQIDILERIAMALGVKDKDLLK